MITGAPDRGVTLAIAALSALPLLTGCAATPVTADAPKSVAGLPLPPYESHDECVRLAPGDRLEYAFEASEPVAFDIRYREGAAVVAPIVREQSRTDAGVFIARIAREYCLMWEAGAAGAHIDYRLRLRPAAH
jgi:hypothetical protein